MAHKSEPNYALLTCEQRKAVLDMLEQPGSSFHKVAEHFGVGKSSIKRIKKNMIHRRNHSEQWVEMCLGKCSDWYQFPVDRSPGPC